LEPYSAVGDLRWTHQQFTRKYDW